MPAPILIGAAVVAVSAASVGAIAVYQVAVAQRWLKLVAKKRIAILGRAKVGKTTLLAHLANPKGDRTFALTSGAPRGEFVMEIGDKPISFDVPRELPSYDGLGHPTWKEAFKEASYVWYLFRADLVAEADKKYLRTLKSDLDMLAAWAQTKGNKQVILIGTSADRSDDWQRDPRGFEESIAKSQEIKVGMLKLSNAPLVVGSLDGKKSADTLVRNLQRKTR